MEIMTPSTFAQLILSSSRPSIFSGGMSASAWVFLGEGDNHLLGLAHVELHLVALLPLSAVIGDVLQAGVSAGDVAALPGGSVVHKLHSAPALQQVIDHEEEDDGADTRFPGARLHFTGSQSLTLCSTLTRCCQPCRKAPTHDTMNSRIPSYPSLLSRIWCSIKSKALR